MSDEISLEERIERLERAVAEIAKVVSNLPWDSCTFLSCDEDIIAIEMQVKDDAKQDEG